MLAMDIDTFYKDHWRDVEPERFAVYEKIFKYSPAHEQLLAPAGFENGQVVVDYGCGPGAMAVELARRVGPEGHVHGVDINAQFVVRARERAEQEGVGDRVTVHRIDSHGIPLEDAIADRVLCKNVLEYVDDPLATLQDIRRVLKPGGKVHATDSDWGFLIAEPLSAEDTAELMAAASHAFRTPAIGRKLYGLCRAAGFNEIAVRVVGIADTSGARAGILNNMANYARDGGTLPEARLNQLMAAIEAGVEDGTYLFVLPQFLVTGTA